MSKNHDFDSPTFSEVIAYMYGVADGVRAARQGAGALTCSPGSNGCREARTLVTAQRSYTACDEMAALPTVSPTVLPTVSPTVSPSILPSIFPAEDRASGILLRVVPLQAEWYAPTGTDGDHKQGSENSRTTKRSR